jgi:hypothetical protein
VTFEHRHNGEVFDIRTVQRRGSGERERRGGMKLGQTDRAMRVMFMSRLLARPISGLRAGQCLKDGILMKMRAGGSDPSIRPRLDDVEYEMDRQKGLDGKRSKTEPRAQADSLHPSEHRAQRIMDLIPPLPRGRL